MLFNYILERNWNKIKKGWYPRRNEKDSFLRNDSQKMYHAFDTLKTRVNKYNTTWLVLKGHGHNVGQIYFSVFNVYNAS